MILVLPIVEPSAVLLGGFLQILKDTSCGVFCNMFNTISIISLFCLPCFCVPVLCKFYGAGTPKKAAYCFARLSSGTFHLVDEGCLCLRFGCKDSV